MRQGVVLVVVGALAAAPAASADERIVAAPVNQYATPNVTIDQGEALFFRNADLSQHDVVARQNGPNGRPLFSTPLIGPGAEAEVTGARSLTAGRYDFYCTIHPNMTGALTVSSAGTPQPGPGGGGSGGSSGDSQAPAVEARILDSSASRVRRARRVRVRVQMNEPGRAELTVTAERSGRPVTVARGTHEFASARSARISLPLTRRGRRAVRAGRTLRLAAVGRDGAGNQGSATTQRRLRR
jgi:plastocyanin